MNNVWKKDFPILAKKNREKHLVYLDTAATAQKPGIVLQAIDRFYLNENANIHRGIYELSEQASYLYEQARERVARFINADSKEVVFTKGTTESLNAIAHSLGSTLQAGDEIVLTGMEHHSNIVPWQQIANTTGAVIKVVRVDERGELDMAHYRQLLSPQTKVVGVVHVSNVLGTVNPIAEMAELAHQVSAHIVVDGAQAVAHLPVDVKALDVDFYAFSGHKLYGPTGVGVLYAKKNLLDALPPYQTGGGMIETVSWAETTFAETPSKWEAGTPPIAAAIGLAVAVDYIASISLKTLMAHEAELTRYTVQKLRAMPTIHLMGTSSSQLGVISFTVAGAHSYDVGALLDAEGIAVRTGHHCTMPLHQQFNVASSVRVSFGIYNDRDDVDRFIMALEKVIGMLT